MLRAFTSLSRKQANALKEQAANVGLAVADETIFDGMIVTTIYNPRHVPALIVTVTIDCHSMPGLPGNGAEILIEERGREDEHGDGYCGVRAWLAWDDGKGFERII